MIVVLPDSKTVHNGSMYSSSVTTGDFERFVAHDVVAYIDAHYRTIADRDEPRPRRPLDGRLRRDAHRHEACRRVRQPLHHEPVLPVGARRRARRTRELEKALAAVKTPADSASLPFFAARAARHGGRVVAEPEEPAALSRPADEGRRAAAGRAREMGGERAARLRRSVHRQPARSIAPSRSTSATRTACGPTPASCTTCSTATASRTRFEIYPARTPARWPTASRTTCCRSSARRLCFDGRSASEAGMTRPWGLRRDQLNG